MKQKVGTTIEHLTSQVLKLLQRRPTDSFRYAEITSLLGLQSESEKRALRKVLHHLAETEIIQRVKGKGYRYISKPSRIIGRLSVTKQGTGIVEAEGGEVARVFIPHRFLGTALDGDRVRVALFAEPSSRRAEGSSREEMPEGEIVEVLERGRSQIVGTMEKSHGFFFVVPDNTRLTRNVYIPRAHTKGARPGEKVVAELMEWNSTELNPEGRIVEVLGKAGDPHVEILSVAREHNLPLAFPRDVCAEAKAIPESIPEEEIRLRRDLRNLLTFTIDPEDAKDFDDAVSLEVLDGGRMVLGVHIADVSYYVREGSALDREAFRRGTSVYLPTTVIPMLPEKLSNNLCSLRQGEDRLTYSVLMEVNKEGRVISYEIVRTIIRSRRRFTYEEVQKIIETGKGRVQSSVERDFAETIQRMHELSQVLLKKRLREGSIDFESAEAAFRFDDRGYPVEIIKKRRTEATSLIEEFMLLANKTVAEHINRIRRGGEAKPFVYRVHDVPDHEKLRELANYVKQFGFRLHVDGGTSSRSLQRLIEQVRGSEVEELINEVAIRSMAKAVYSPNNIGHYGLGFSHYTQFTSPIRRYPDLLVHRLLTEYQQGMSAARVRQWMDRLDELCKHASAMEQNALEAERQAVRVMQVEFMKRHIGDVFAGMISGVTSYGIFVEITDLLIEGMVHVRDMEDDYYVYDEKQYALVGRRTKREYRLGSRVMVRVVSVDVERRQVTLALVEE